MKTEYSTKAAIKAAAAIRKRAATQQPKVGIILGSGLGGLSKSIADSVRVPFGDIPGFPEVTVAGHEGAVIVGSLGGREVVALSGRFHMYEGHPAALAAFPVRVFHALGAQELFVSNAAGGISSKLAVGDLNVFQGNQTLHRVSPVQGARKRIVGLFSYDRQPGTNFGEPYIAELRRRTPGTVPLDRGSA